MENIKAKEQKLREYIKGLKSVVVAFSGGIDSTLVLKIALEELGRDKVLAVTGRSQTYPSRELDLAQRLAQELGSSQLVIDTDELADDNYRQNPTDRCFYCKSDLFSKLSSIAVDRSFDNIVDGSNADDLSDHRPGSKAASEYRVVSPLQECGFTKKDIRNLGKKCDLENWNKPSMACLASRFSYGQEIDVEKLNKIEKAEEFLQDLGIKQVRVRLDNNTARLEVLKEDFSLVFEHSQEITNRLEKLGFTHIALDLGGYKSGSLNKGLQVIKTRRLEYA